MARIRGLLAVALLAALAGCSRSQPVESTTVRKLDPPPPPPPAANVMGATLYKLNDKTYLRWPLPVEFPRYGRIDGSAMKPYVDRLVGISEKSHKDGNQWWGRITSTKYHEEAQDWIAGRFKELGLETRKQTFDLPPIWWPLSWSMSASSGGASISMKTAEPMTRSAPTPKDGLEAEVVYVGMGTKAEIMKQDLRGKIVVIYSVPNPSALRHSALAEAAVPRAEEAGAAAVIVILALPGNVTTQLWGTYDSEQTRDPVPVFSIGQEDGLAIRKMIEGGRPVTMKIRLDVETRTGLKPNGVWGVLPGLTDENILITAHSDAFFQGAGDNASGVSVMLGLAEYFAKIPKQQRRRTMTFFVPVGHHVARDPSLQWVHDNMKDLFKKTALIINCEHVTTTALYRFNQQLVRSNAAIGHRHFVGGSKQLKDIFVKDFLLFGVALYETPQIRPTGDLRELGDLAPGIEVIESNEFYHSDMDVNTVPAAGLEGIARAYAKIIDDVNRLDLKDLIDASGTK